MTASEIFYKMSEKLDLTDLTTAQRLNVRDIISDVLNEHLTDEIKQIKIKLESNPITIQP